MAWKKISLPDKIYDFDFLSLCRKCRDPRLKVRLLAMSHLQDGVGSLEVSKKLKVSRSSVEVWLNRFSNYGLEGLKDLPKSGRKRKFNLENTAKLKSEIVELEKSKSGGTLKGTDIQKYLYSQYNINCCLSSVYNLLHTLGLSWISCRSQHPNGNIKEQLAYKKTSKNLLEKK
jgi:transposase